MTPRNDRHVNRTNAELTVMRRLNRETTSLVVSYTCGEESATRVGRGATMAERVLAADSQLPPSEWRREVVSTPASVYADLVGRPRDARPGVGDSNHQGMPVYPAYERKTVSGRVSA